MKPEPSPSLPLSASPRGALLTVTVVPRASRSEMDLLADGTIRVRLAAAPVDGAANLALLRFLAKKLGIPQSRLSMVSGASSRRKRIAVEGMRADELDSRLRAEVTRHF